MKHTNRLLLNVAVATMFLFAAGFASAGDRHETGANGPDPDMQGMDMDNMAGMDGNDESFWFGQPAAKDARVDKIVVVNAEDIKFIPASVTVKKGQTVEFQVVNKGAVRHELVLGDAQEQREHEKEMAAMPDMKMNDPNAVSVEPGRTGALRWTFTQAGTLEYACHQPGHFAAGMVGTLTVTE